MNERTKEDELKDDAMDRLIRRAFDPVLTEPVSTSTSKWLPARSFSAKAIWAVNLSNWPSKSPPLWLAVKPTSRALIAHSTAGQCRVVKRAPTPIVL